LKPREWRPAQAAALCPMPAIRCAIRGRQPAREGGRGRAPPAVLREVGKSNRVEPCATALSASSSHSR
jgi:hypothetical protein